MGESASPLWIFLDLVALTPLIFLVRMAVPHERAMRGVFIAVGLYTYYLVGPRFVLFFAFYWCAIWLLQSLLSAANRCGLALRIFVTASAIGVALAPMLWWKLDAIQFAESANRLSSQLLWNLFPPAIFADALFGLIVPLGLSFTMFRAVDLLVKVRIELLEPQSLSRTLFYGFFPPVLALGPISEFEEVKLEGPVARWPDATDVTVGTVRVALGLLKVLLAASYLERIASWAWRGGAAEWWMLWLAVLCHGAYFYANFSGYSDLAIGVARLWGFRLKENFNNPFLKTNPQLFWASWHMSLTRWAQRNVFVPLGGMRKNRQYGAIFATIMVIALWHGLELPLIVFGLYHAAILIAHRWLAGKRRIDGMPVATTGLVGALKKFAVFFYVSLSIPLFHLPAAEIVPFYRSLLPFG